jgi:hypothetical protein
VVVNNATYESTLEDQAWNNVRTAKAGALGLRFEATPERLAFVRSLTLQPGIAERVYQRYFADLADLPPSLSFKADPLSREPEIAARRVLWVSLGARHYIGMSADGMLCYLAAVLLTDSLADGYGHHGSIAGRMYVALRYEATSERQTFWRSKLPSWVGTVSPGRYVIPGGLGGWVADNAADAARIAVIFDIPLDFIQVTPGVTLIHSSKHQSGGYSKRYLQLWSDGVKTGYQLASLAENRHEAQVRAETEGKPLADRQFYPHVPDEWGGIPEPPNQLPPMSLSDDAASLLSIALNQRLWHEGELWRELLVIERILKRELITEKNGETMGWNWALSITRLIVLMQDQTQQIYYHGQYHGGGIGPGGDGEEDSETVLLRDETEAQSWFLQYQHMMTK